MTNFKRLTITKLRSKQSDYRDAKSKLDQQFAIKLRDEGFCNVDIASIMKKKESQVRYLLDPENGLEGE